MTTLKEYPYWPAETLDDLKSQIRDITNTRKDDISQIQNLTNIFVSGRSVGRIPSSSIDVIDGDRVGDFNVNSTFAYYLINNAGTAEWVRVAVGGF